MAIDINQFLQTFIEESLEMLQDMEKALLELELNAVDPEKINQIFRAIHTIKSSSVVFNFTVISDFNHTVESFLELIRIGKRIIQHDDVNNLLAAVDCLRSMILNVKNKKPINDEKEKELTIKFKDLLRMDAGFTNMLSVKKYTQVLTNEKIIGWHIDFQPDRFFLQKNNDCCRIFAVLAELGKLIVKINSNRLPGFSDLDPTVCYLDWHLTLYTDADIKEIKEIFSWVANEDSLVISPCYLENNELENVPAPTDKHIKQTNTSALQNSIRVATHKIDTLINIVGELVITQSMLNQICENFDVNRLSKLYEILSHLQSNSKELQENIMRIRMVPISFAFNRLPRMLHDMAQKMGKQVELIITGEQTELDKTMIEKIVDPLLHLTRNALDHGIETPEQRIAAGKSPKGIIELSAYQADSNIVISIKDDGKGIDKEKIYTKAKANKLIDEKEEVDEAKIYQMMFQPGFSTADKITDISGRGVGLDVVYKNIHGLGGTIDVQSVFGQGSEFNLRIPLTLAIMDCQLIRVADQTYIVPLIAIVEIIKIDLKQISYLDSKNRVYQLRNDHVPIISLRKVFGLSTEEDDLLNKVLLIVAVEDQLFGLVCDELLSQQQVVIKSLEDNYCKIPEASGATILGDGGVALIVDVNTVVDRALNPAKYLVEKSLERLVTPVMELTSLVESTIQETVNDNTTFQFLSFLMGEQEYGIDIFAVKEIRSWEKITTLPNAPSYMKGVINLRGNIIPILDLRDYFVPGQHECTSATSIITVAIRDENKQRMLGLVVDAVTNTYSVMQTEIKAAPDRINSVSQYFIKGLVNLENKIISLLYTKNIITLLYKHYSVHEEVLS